MTEELFKLLTRYHNRAIEANNKIDIIMSNSI